LISAIRRYGLPAILAGLDDPGHQLDPDVRWARTFPHVPAIGERLPDGHGADPAAWYVQPAGTESDSSSAELASDIALRRPGAAEVVAGEVRNDPRALPALLNRLERDPSPRIRHRIAWRLLTPLAQDPQVRSAPHAAAAEDEDLQVRWAARYALRLDLWSRRSAVAALPDNREGHRISSWATAS
jgi:HEAT repeat protein